MQVFSEMAYERPDMEETLRFIEDSARKAAGADSYEKAREIFLALLEKLRHVSTMETIASIRNTADMTDVFYEKEMEYFHAGNPRLEIAREAFYKVLLESPFLPDFQKEFGEIYFKRMENAGRLTSEKNVELQVEESHLSQQYAKISATCTAKFHGETLNFYGLLKKMQDTDRGVRRDLVHQNQLVQPHAQAREHARRDFFEPHAGKMPQIPVEQQLVLHRAVNKARGERRVTAVQRRAAQIVMQRAVRPRALLGHGKQRKRRGFARRARAFIDHRVPVLRK